MEKVMESKEKIRKDQTGAQSVFRTISLIRAVSKYNEKGARLSKIAQETNLHVATARRILSVLVSEGFMTFNPVTKLYHLGMEMYHLGGMAHQVHIRDIFRPLIEQIAVETEDTVFLLIRSGYDVLCVDLVEGKFPIRTMTISIGDRRPLGIGAGSLALIAFLGAKEFEQILAVNGPRYPQYNGITAATIQVLAADSQKQGYVVSRGLFHDGVTSLGIPIFQKNGDLVAVITVAAIDKRMDNRRQKKIVEYVKTMADQTIT